MITHYGLPAAKVLEFKAYALPHFLEAPSRGMKLADEGRARTMYDRIKASDLYDSALGMYKTSVSLEEKPMKSDASVHLQPAGWSGNPYFCI